jgi:uncharacterized protein (TIGR02145 family)
MNKTYKSIFDPCPQGYRVPPEDTWVGFTTTKANSDGATKYPEWNIANNGAYNSGTNTFAGNVTSNDTYKLLVAGGYAFYYQGYGSGNTDFYSASGFRDRVSGNAVNVGRIGGAWSSAPQSTNARYLNISSTYVNPLVGLYRAFGFTVRCLKEPTQ